MSVLVKLIQERQEWAAEHKEQQFRRNAFMAVESVVLLAMGLLAVLYYHRILTTLTVLLGL